MQPSSFIILTNKNLFSHNYDNNKWILFCIASAREIFSEWNTSVLKEDIRNKLVGVNDSNLLRNEFFSQIKNRVEICSNYKENSLCSFMNDQTYLFNIIKKVFYTSISNDSEYQKIINGVILNKYRKSKIFQKLGNHLNMILNGEKYFDHFIKRNEMNPILSCIHDLFNIYNDCNYDTFELISNDKVKEICKIYFTMTFVKRFVTCIIRLSLNQPIIFSYTGSLDSLCIHFIIKLIKIASKEEDFILKSHQHNRHRLQFDEAKKLIKKSSCDKSTAIDKFYEFNEHNTLNTTKDHLIHDIKNTNIIDPQYVHMISINPYLNVSQNARILSKVGIKIIPPKLNK